MDVTTSSLGEAFVNRIRSIRKWWYTWLVQVSVEEIE